MTKIKGPAAQGEAGIFGSSINPMQVYMQYQQRRAQQEYAIAQQQRQRRDKVFDQVAEYNPTAIWDQAGAMVNQMADDLVRQPTKEALLRGEDPNEILVKMGMAKGQVQSFNAETGVWKEKYNDAFKEFSTDAKYKYEIRTALRDVFFDHIGKLKHPDEVRAGLPSLESLRSNPDFLDESVVVKRFMDTLQEQGTKTWGTIPMENGTYLTSKEISAKMPLLRDKNGAVVIDPHTNLPIPTVNDNLYTLAKGSQDIRLLMEKKGGETRAAQDAYLKKVLPGQDKVKYEETIKEGFKKTNEDRKAEWAKWGWGYTVDPSDLMNRHELLKGMTDKWTPESLGIFNHTTKDVRAQYVDFKTDAKGNKIPTKIDITYPSKVEDEKATPEQKKAAYKAHLMGETPLKLHHHVMNLDTEDERLAARVELSEHLDQYDEKRSLGDQYAKFENEMKDKRMKGGIKYTPGKPMF